MKTDLKETQSGSKKDVWHAFVELSQNKEDNEMSNRKTESRFVVNLVRLVSWVLCGAEENRSLRNDQWKHRKSE